MGKKKNSTSMTPFSDALRADPGFVLADVDTRGTPAFEGNKAAGAKALAKADDELGRLQEKLWAQGTAAGTERLLLVVQGMDTSGKGGIMRHVVGSVDPQGVKITAFKKPTNEELRHHFLWRIKKALPAAGYLGVFDRSHYEDVLVVRVHNLVPKTKWSGRYEEINRWEAKVAEDTSIVKVMLHVSHAEQGERLAERLERPDKHWKYNPGDVTERGHWEEYQEAYQAVVENCSTDVAPWYVVPADRKWYARLAVQQLLLEHLRALELSWPEADFDVEVEKARLAAS